ncbi:MAG: hypothetical protein PQJ50_01490, partial [Spirochaetales bacterium]|nr:hypothetical protein [Spirochaetales bacterium]
ELYGLTLYRGIVLPVPLEELAVSSFARIMHLTGGTIGWDRIFTDASWPEWQRVASLQSDLRRDLPFLFETDDGGMNGEGVFALIATGEPSGEEGGLNCSGFAKWVADGMLLARGAEGLLELEPLKEPTDAASRPGNAWSSVRQDRDPYFGLDWCRNLAVALRLSEPGGRVERDTDQDVRTVPFFTYKENVGYELESVKSLMYLQAVKEPGYFYLGAVNSPFGRNPVLWQYHHVALFFPWFDSNGDFHLDVLETGTSSSVENLNARYPKGFVHLSKVKAGSYIPPWQPSEEIVRSDDSIDDSGGIE